MDYFVTLLWKVLIDISIAKSCRYFGLWIFSTVKQDITILFKIHWQTQQCARLSINLHEYTVRKCIVQCCKHVHIDVVCDKVQVSWEAERDEKLVVELWMVFSVDCIHLQNEDLDSLQLCTCVAFWKSFYSVDLDWKIPSLQKTLWRNATIFPFLFYEPKFFFIIFARKWSLTKSSVPYYSSFSFVTGAPQLLSSCWLEP